jgi:hypothetical protein
MNNKQLLKLAFEKAANPFVQALRRGVSHKGLANIAGVSSKLLPPKQQLLNFRKTQLAMGPQGADPMAVLKRVNNGSAATKDPLGNKRLLTEQERFYSSLFDGSLPGQQSSIPAITNRTPAVSKRELKLWGTPGAGKEGLLTNLAGVANRQAPQQAIM